LVADFELAHVGADFCHLPDDFVPGHNAAEKDVNLNILRTRFTAFKGKLA
jgi:hypothetical protein